MASSPTAQIREWVFGQAWARVLRLWTREGSESGRAALAATLARYPEHAATLALLEGRMHRSRGDHAEAAVCFERVLKDGGGEFPVALRPHLWAERAAALVAAGQAEEARAECEALLAQAAPGTGWGYSTLLLACPSYIRAPWCSCPRRKPGPSRRWPWPSGGLPCAARWVVSWLSGAGKRRAGRSCAGPGPHGLRTRPRRRRLLPGAGGRPPGASARNGGLPPPSLPSLRGAGPARPHEGRAGLPMRIRRLG